MKFSWSPTTVIGNANWPVITNKIVYGQFLSFVVQDGQILAMLIGEDNKIHSVDFTDLTFCP
jgi:hypothetical protein